MRTTQDRLHTHLTFGLVAGCPACNQVKTVFRKPVSELAFDPGPECSLCHDLHVTPTRTGWRKCARCQK